MAHRYYHDNYLKKILKLFDDHRYEEVLYEFDKYIKNYPNDIVSYIYCADTYMKLGNFEEAERVLNSAVILDSTSEYNKQTLELFKIKLLCCQKKYQECFDLLMENTSFVINRKWGYPSILLYLKKQLQSLTANDYDRASRKYLLSQIVSYSEEEAISHIGRHTEFEGNDNVAKFVERFPLEDVYFKLRKMLPLEHKIYDDVISDNYVFRYCSNGHIESKLVDYFMVVSVRDSNDIITMYPYENRERRECIDLTPIVEDLSKQKKLSQIDKFNQRYSRTK